jgi:hypothetical protein
VLTEAQVAVLRLQPGDVLVVYFPGTVGMGTANAVAGEVRRVLDGAGHQAVPTLVLDAGMTLGVVRPADLPGEAKP